MKRPAIVGEASIPNGGGTMQLLQGKDDFTITLRGIGGELMSTRKHGSEDALGYLACQSISNRDSASVLIGGLGMGFTLAAALAELGSHARVTVAELVPEVVEWNRGPLGERAGRPLDDPRTTVKVTDVMELLKASEKAYDVIALDVDNGPEGLTTQENTALYSRQGIATTLAALEQNGVISYWSATGDRAFCERLRRCGLKVKERRVFAHGHKGTRHFIYLASLQ